MKILVIGILFILLVLVGLYVADLARFENEFGSYNPNAELDRVIDTWETPDLWPTPSGYQGPVYE